MTSQPHESDGLPTYEDLERTAAQHGFTIDESIGCPIQGVLIRFSRPIREGETFMGLKVVGEDDRQHSEVIERHFCPGDADDARMGVTYGRAVQYAIWDMEAYGR